MRAADDMARSWRYATIRADEYGQSIIAASLKPANAQPTRNQSNTNKLRHIKSCRIPGRAALARTPQQSYAEFIFS